MIDPVLASWVDSVKRRSKLAEPTERRKRKRTPVALKERRRQAAERLAVKLQFLEARGGRCLDCGEDRHHALFEFDHRDPAEKCGEVMSLLHTKGYVAAELEARKCDLVCANCHRIRTWERRNR